MGDIDFSIGDGPVRILTWTVGGCRPATTSECALWDRIEALKRENAELRLTISKCAAALGNGAYISTEASLGFMAELPKEISIVTAERRAAKEQARREVLEEAAKAVDDMWRAGMSVGSLAAIAKAEGRANA